MGTAPETLRRRSRSVERGGPQQGAAGAGRASTVPQVGFHLRAWSEAPGFLRTTAALVRLFRRTPGAVRLQLLRAPRPAPVRQPQHLARPGGDAGLLPQRRAPRGRAHVLRRDCATSTTPSAPGAPCTTASAAPPASPGRGGRPPGVLPPLRGRAAPPARIPCPEAPAPSPGPRVRRDDPRGDGRGERDAGADGGGRPPLAGDRRAPVPAPEPHPRPVVGGDDPGPPGAPDAGPGREPPALPRCWGCSTRWPCSRP